MPSYTRTNWLDFPSTATPITAARLNNLETGVVDANSIIVSCTSTTRPNSPFVGQQIYETNTNYLRVWNGTRWQMLPPYPVVTSLPSSPITGDEAYYQYTGTNNLNNTVHIRYNGTRWMPVAASTLVRWSCGSASQVVNSTNVVNITTGDYNTVTFTPPWDGYYEFSIYLRNVQLNSGIGIYVYFSNANFSANYEVAYFEDANGYTYHTRIPLMGPKVEYLYASNTYRWATNITYAAGNSGTLFTAGTAYVKAVG